MQRRSILYQLKAYQPKEENLPQIIVPEHDRQPKYDYKEILKRIIGGEVEEKYLNELLYLLYDMELSENVDVLYPIELAILYHLGYRHQCIICGEKTTNEFMIKFLKSQPDRKAYGDTLIKNMDETANKIFMARVLLATYGNQQTMDGLPMRFRQLAAQKLSCRESERVASDILDGLKGATVEQQILGRIVYVAFWHEQKGEVGSTAPAAIAQARYLTHQPTSS